MKAHHRAVFARKRLKFRASGRAPASSTGRAAPWRRSSPNSSSALGAARPIWWRAIRAHSAALSAVKRPLAGRRQRKRGEIDRRAVAPDRRQHPVEQLAGLAADQACRPRNPRSRACRPGSSAPTRDRPRAGCAARPGAAKLKRLAVASQAWNRSSWPGKASGDTAAARAARSARLGFGAQPVARFLVDQRHRRPPQPTTAARSRASAGGNAIGHLSPRAPLSQQVPGWSTAK